MRLTLSPRASRRQPMEAAARPLPREDTTPPVTKMYFADMSATSLYMFLICAWCARLSIAGPGGRRQVGVVGWGVTGRGELLFYEFITNSLCLLNGAHTAFLRRELVFWEY